jgi:hypothetical protein
VGVEISRDKSVDALEGRRIRGTMLSMNDETTVLRLTKIIVSLAKLQSRGTSVYKLIVANVLEVLAHAV